MNSLLVPVAFIVLPGGLAAVDVYSHPSEVQGQAHCDSVCWSWVTGSIRHLLCLWWPYIDLLWWTACSDNLSTCKWSWFLILRFVPVAYSGYRWLGQTTAPLTLLPSFQPLFCVLSWFFFKHHLPREPRRVCYSRSAATVFQVLPEIAGLHKTTHSTFK